LENTISLVFAFRSPYNLRDVADLATMNAAKLAIRPAHLFDVIKALVIGGESLGYVYHFHGRAPCSDNRTLPESEVCVKCIITL